jgi:hypothetical protein
MLADGQFDLVGSKVAPLSAAGCEEDSDQAPPSSNNPILASESDVCGTVWRVQRPNIQTPSPTGAQRSSRLVHTTPRAEVLSLFPPLTPPTIAIASDLFAFYDVPE